MYPKEIVNYKNVSIIMGTSTQNVLPLSKEIVDNYNDKLCYLYTHERRNYVLVELGFKEIPENIEKIQQDCIKLVKKYFPKSKGRVDFFKKFQEN